VDILLIILIIGFLAITLSSTWALVVMRRRDQNREDSAIIEKTISDLDTALDSSLTEINKMGALVLKEVDEKYQSILFMYNLMEDKQKELTSEVWKNPDGNQVKLDSAVIAEMVEKYIEAHSEKLRLIKDEVETPVEIPQVEATVQLHDKPPKFSNPRHKQVWEMYERGLDVPDIAKTLGIGQGEIKLILELASRTS